MSNYSKIFNNLCGLLKRQLDGNAAEQAIDSTRKRIKTVYDAAISNGEQPEHPGFNDEIFTTLNWVGIELPSDQEESLPEPEDNPNPVPARPREGNSLNPEYIPMPAVRNLAEAQALVAKLQAQQTIERRRINRLHVQIQDIKTRIKRMLKAEGSGRRYIAQPRLINRKPIPPGPCWCGCGQMIESKQGRAPRRFRRGHITKYLHEIVAVERAGKKIEDLPELLRKNLKWVKCKHCHRPIPTTDPHGRPIQENVGLACYRRVHKVDWPYEPVNTRC